MFKVNYKTVFSFTLFLLISNSALGYLGVAFGSGQGINDITPYRIAVSWDFGTIWRENETWGLGATWENSFALWSGPQMPTVAPDRPCTLNAATSGPMLRWQKHHPLSKTHIVPYSELGVGLSWLSETEIQGRVLSLHFQFEDKFGLGARFGSKQQYDLALRVYHYSNASIKRPNSGVNLAMINFGVWFI